MAFLFGHKDGRIRRAGGYEGNEKRAPCVSREKGEERERADNEFILCAMNWFHKINQVSYSWGDVTCSACVVTCVYV